MASPHTGALDLPGAAEGAERDGAAPRSLGRAGTFWTAAAVAAIALWTSAAPTTSYPLYASSWGLPTAVTSMVFAVYPIVLVVVLLVFGDLSDAIGRRATILIGLAASLAGVVLFALAPSVGWIFAGRALMGVGVGFSLSPATAAMVESSRPGAARAASSMTTAATALGLALATLVGGGLIQYAPLPLHLDYVVLAVVVAAVLVVAWFLPRPRPEERHRWRPRALVIPRGLRAVFVTAAFAVSTAYALGSVILALGAEVAGDLVHSDNALVTGAILSTSSVLIGVVAIATRGVRAIAMLRWAALVTAVGVALLVASAELGSLALFLAASAVAGAAYSLLFSGGIALVTRFAPDHHRAGMTSAVYLVAYLVQGVAAVGLGALATDSGLAIALLLGSILILALGIGTLVATLASPPPR